MKIPFTRLEIRSGGFTEDAIDSLTQRVAGTAINAGESAAVQVAAGMLARVLMSATVTDDGGALTPEVLARIGRSLVERGESLHTIHAHSGRPWLSPADHWTFMEGDAHPSTWRLTVTENGPTRTRTSTVAYDDVLLVRWMSRPLQPWWGIAPARAGRVAGDLAASAEQALAYESRGPVAQMLPVPIRGDSKQIGKLLAGIGDAKGKAVAVKSARMLDGNPISTHSALKDWVSERLGPNPPAPLVELARQAYFRLLAVCGVPAALGDESADGTAQRESLRRYHLHTVVPFTRLIEVEARTKLELPDLKISHDPYALDMLSRASVIDKLAKHGISAHQAMEIVGLTPET